MLKEAVRAGRDRVFPKAAGRRTGKPREKVAGTNSRRFNPAGSPNQSGRNCQTGSSG